MTKKDEVGSVGGPLENFLKFTDLECLKFHLNSPPWLEKILRFADLEYLKFPLNSPPWLEEILILLISNVYGLFKMSLRCRNSIWYFKFSPFW